MSASGRIPQSSTAWKSLAAALNEQQSVEGNHFVVSCFGKFYSLITLFSLFRKASKIPPMLSQRNVHVYCFHYYAFIVIIMCLPSSSSFYKKESLSNDGQQFHQMSTKRTITSHLHSLNTKKITTYDIGNPVPSLGHAFVIVC